MRSSTISRNLPTLVGRLIFCTAPLAGAWLPPMRSRVSRGESLATQSARSCSIPLRYTLCCGSSFGTAVKHYAPTSLRATHTHSRASSGRLCTFHALQLAARRSESGAAPRGRGAPGALATRTLKAGPAPAPPAAPPGAQCATRPPPPPR